MEVADQFKNLNVGAVDIVYDQNSDQGANVDGFPPGGPGGFPSGAGGGFPGGTGFRSGSGRPPGPGGYMSRRTSTSIALKESDLADLTTSLEGLISDGTISYTTKADVEGGLLSESSSMTIAGVKENYARLSNLDMEIGEFFSEESGLAKEKICVLGAKAARDIFGSAYDAYDNAVYIDSRPYIVSGVAVQMGNVSSGISPDDAIFIPYETGIKYLTGQDVNPTITVIAKEVEEVPAVIAQIQEVLSENYPNNTFSISDAGSRMEAASKSNQTLQLLLIAMACIVFLVGGIGIMNVLFVSVNERTREIGILKAIGYSRSDILLEFLIEAACISLVGALLGLALGFGITPIIESFNIRVELAPLDNLLALAFGLLTGSIFGFYPAYKASRLVPVQALNAE